MRQLFLRFYPGLLALVLVTACAPGLKRPLDAVSADERTQMNAHLQSALVQRLGGQCGDATLRAALDQAALRLMLPVASVVLVNDAAPELIDLPAGSIVVSRGLLASVPDADTLTALLAHARGHLAHQHALQAVLRVTAASPSGDDSPVASWGATVSAALLAQHYTEAEEMAADASALPLLAAAGIDPHVWLRQLLPDAAAGGSPGRHPLSARRLAAAQRIADGLVPGAALAVDPAVFAAARSTLDTLQPGYALYRQARLTEKAGSIDRALPLYLQAAEQGPEEPLLLTGLGMAYLRQDALVAARQHLIRAAHIDGNYYYSQLGLGYIALLQNDPARAVSHLQRSLKLLPTVRGGFLLAEARAARGETESAIPLYRAVLAADPKGFGRTAQTRLRALGVTP